MISKWYVWCPKCERRNVLDKEETIQKCPKCGRLLKNQPIRVYTEEMYHEDLQKEQVNGNKSICKKSALSDMNFQLRGEGENGEPFIIDILSEKGEFFTVGRCEQSFLSSPYISRKHATIQVKEVGENSMPEIRIWDHSLNGTLVNGNPLISYERSDIKSTMGELIKLGDVIVLDANGAGTKLVLQQKA